LSQTCPQHSAFKQQPRSAEISKRILLDIATTTYCTLPEQSRSRNCVNSHKSLQMLWRFRAIDSVLGIKKTRRRQRVPIAAIQDNSLFSTSRTGFCVVVPSCCARLRYVPSTTLIIFRGENCFYLSGHILTADMWCAISANGFTSPAFFSETINS